MLKTTHQVDSFYFTRRKGSSGLFTAWGGIQIYPTSCLWSSLAGAGTRGQSVILCDLSWVNVCIRQLKSFLLLCVSANNHKSTTNVDFEITNKFYQVGKFANVESTNNESVLPRCKIAGS